MSRCSSIDREKAARAAARDRRRQELLRRLGWHSRTGITVEAAHASVAEVPTVGLESTRAHLEELARRGLAQHAFDLWWPTTDRHGDPITPTPPITEESTSEESTMSACPSPTDLTRPEAIRSAICAYLDASGPSATLDIAAHVLGMEPGSPATAMGNHYQRIYGQLNRLYQLDAVNRVKKLDDDGRHFIEWHTTRRRPMDDGPESPRVENAGAGVAEVPAGTATKITQYRLASIVHDDGKFIAVAAGDSLEHGRRSVSDTMPKALVHLIEDLGLAVQVTPPAGWELVPRDEWQGPATAQLVGSAKDLMLHELLEQVGALFGLEDEKPEEPAARLRVFLEDLGERAGRCAVAAGIEVDENLDDADYLRDVLNLLQRHLEETPATEPARTRGGISGDEVTVLRERIAQLEEQNKRLGVELDSLHRLVGDTETQLRSYGIKDFNDLVDGVYKLGQRGAGADSEAAADLDTMLALVEGLLQDCGVPVGTLESRKVRVAWVRDSFIEVARKVRTLKARSRDELQSNVLRWLAAAGASVGEDIESRIQLMGSHVRELGKELNHHTKLNQEAHDVLDAAGAPRGGAPAHRIRNLIVKLADGVLPMTVTDGENGDKELYRLTVDSISGKASRRDGIPDHLTLCREDLTGLFHPREEHAQYVSEHLIRAACERAGCDGLDLEEMNAVDLVELLESAAGHTGPRWPWSTEGATEIEVLIGMTPAGELVADVIEELDRGSAEELVDNLHDRRANWVSFRVPVPLPEVPRVVRLGGAA